MADIKITALPALAATADVLDVLAIVDVSDNGVTASGTTKSVLISELPYLANGSNISLLTNDSGYKTVSDFSNNGEAATANRDIGNTDAFGLSLITSGLGRINILSGGDVGIGTSAPTAKLQVEGNLKVNQATGVSTFTGTGASDTRIDLHNASTASLVRLRFGSSGAGSNASIAYNGATAGIIGAFYQNSLYTSATNGVKRIEATTGGYFIVTDNGALSAPVTRLEMNTSGRFGFGTTPDALILASVGGSIKVDGMVQLLEFALMATPPANYGRVYAKTDGKVYYKNAAGTDYNLTNDGIYGGSGSLIAATTVTNAGFDLGITGTGNFGIGTAAPTEKLDVIGGAKIGTLRHDGSLGYAQLRHSGLASSIANYAFTQDGTGFTTVNGISILSLRLSNAEKLRFNTTNAVFTPSVVFNGLNAIHAPGNNSTITIGATFDANTSFRVRGGTTNLMSVGNVANEFLNLNSDGTFKLSSVTGGFLLAPMTFTEAGGLTATNGTIVYVTNTDATFTSVGFWGLEAGTWVKF
mgnify:CR=1 FL=1